jgi:mRNA interferase MazF
MKRGDIVTVVPSGDYGKPRPAVIIQSDWLDETDSVLVCLMMTAKRALPLYRIDVSATRETGLREQSQIMVEKIMAIRRDKCAAAIGRLDDGSLVTLNRMLALMVGVAE